MTAQTSECFYTHLRHSLMNCDDENTDDWDVDGVIAIVQGVNGSSICVVSSHTNDGIMLELPKYTPYTLFSDSSFLTKVNELVLLVVLLEFPIRGTYALHVNSIGNRSLYTNQIGCSYGVCLSSLLRIIKGKKRKNMS